MGQAEEELQAVANSLDFKDQIFLKICLIFSSFRAKVLLNPKS